MRHICPPHDQAITARRRDSDSFAMALKAAVLSMCTGFTILCCKGLMHCNRGVTPADPSLFHSWLGLAFWSPRQALQQRYNLYCGRYFFDIFSFLSVILVSANTITSGLYAPALSAVSVALFWFPSGCVRTEMSLHFAVHCATHTLGFASMFGLWSHVSSSPVFAGVLLPRFCVILLAIWLFFSAGVWTTLPLVLCSTLSTLAG